MEATNTANKTAVEQLIEIRDSGATNMMDMQMVQYLASERGMHELVIAIEDGGTQEYMQLLNAVGRQS